MNVKTSFREYSKKEFMCLIETIRSKKINTSQLLGLIKHFDKIVGHPAGVGLIYFPESDADDSVEGIIQSIQTWRADAGLPGFRV